MKKIIRKLASMGLKIAALTTAFLQMSPAVAALEHDRPRNLRLSDVLATLAQKNLIRFDPATGKWIIEIQTLNQTGELAGFEDINLEELEASTEVTSPFTRGCF